MRVQRVVMPGAEGVSWTVVDALVGVVEPIEAFLTHLSDQECSPNTAKAYAHDLRDFFEYLEHRALEWQKVGFDDVAAFKPWLRMPPDARRGRVSVLPTVSAHCSESSINRKLAAVLSFYRFHRRHGVPVSDTISGASRAVSTRTTWQPFLAHVSPRRVQRSDLKLRMPESRPRTIGREDAQHIIDSCLHLRDRFLFALLYDSGIRIGEALGLRHEDIQTGDQTVEIRARQNANGARAKTWGRVVPVSPALLRLHAEYLFEEYGDTDSDYVFISLWSTNPGRALTYTAVNDLVIRTRKRTGIHFTPHMFRHTYATRLLRSGVPAEIVQRLLGHASAATTVDTYGHLTTADLRRALEKAGWMTAEPKTMLSSDRMDVELWH